MIRLNKINSFNFFKGICCIACVFIHYNFPGILGTVVRTVSRIAVPYFFFVSGYFLLQDNCTIGKERLRNKIIHIMKMICYSSLFYGIFCVLWHNLLFKDWIILNFINSKVTIENTIKLFITNDPFVYAHLWFLLALLYCYLIMWGGNYRSV